MSLRSPRTPSILSVFFFNDAATTEIYTLSLHDALPIYRWPASCPSTVSGVSCAPSRPATREDRKSTRLNSSHRCISYAVFCLKKKNSRKIAIVLYELLHSERRGRDRAGRYYQTRSPPWM